MRKHWIGIIKWNDGTILKTEPFYDYDEGIKAWSSKFSYENKGKFEWIDYEKIEEPKQETLEEVAERYANMHQDVSEELGTYLVKAVFQDGAKWQQEQCKKDLDAHLEVAEDLWLQVVKQNKNLYSEEDLKEAFNVGFNVGYNDETSPSYLTFEKWFEQIKKK